MLIRCLRSEIRSLTAAAADVIVICECARRISYNSYIRASVVSMSVFLPPNAFNTIVIRRLRFCRESYVYSRSQSLYQRNSAPAGAHAKMFFNNYVRLELL